MDGTDNVPNKKNQQPSQWLGGLALLGPSGLWLLLLLVLPTLVIFELSLVPNIRPGDLVNPSGFDNYFRIFCDVDADSFCQLNIINLFVVVRSLGFAIGTMVICLLLGFPVAYWIAQLSPPRWRNLILMGFVLPLWTSSLLRTYAWISILRPTGLLNTVLEFFHLPALDLLNRSSAVLIGMAYGYLPYMVLILFASIEKLDRRLLEAASDLGATPWQAFIKVTIPQTFPGIAAGSLLVFITSLGDFVDPELLGGGI